MNILAESHACEVAVLERVGHYLRVGSSSRLNPDTPVQWEAEGRSYLGLVIACAPRGERFDVWLEAQESFDRDRSLHPSWLESRPESVLDGLLKLNERLTAFSHLPGGKDCAADTGNSGTLHS